MNVRDVMTTNVVTSSPDETLSAVAHKMYENDFGSCPVVERDHLVGLVTDRDITVRAVAKGLDPNSTMVSEVMTTDLITGDPDMSIEDACELMAENQIRRLPIVEGSRLVGIISIADLAMELEEEEMLSDLVTRVSAPAHQHV